MPKFDLVKPGDTLYDVRATSGTARMFHKWEWWTVRVISIDYKKRAAMCSWNGNRERLYFARDIERLRRSLPKKEK